MCLVGRYTTGEARGSVSKLQCCIATPSTGNYPSTLLRAALAPSRCSGSLPFVTLHQRFSNELTLHFFVVVIASPSRDGGRRPRRPRRDARQRYNLYRSQPPGGGSSAITDAIDCSVVVKRVEFNRVTEKKSPRLTGTGAAVSQVSSFQFRALPGWMALSRPSNRGDTNECRRRRGAAKETPSEPSKRLPATPAPQSCQGGTYSPMSLS